MTSSLKGKRLGFLIPSLLLLVVVFAIPVVLVIGSAFQPEANAFGKLFSPTFVAITLRTLGIAAAVALISLVVAYPVAYLAASSGKRASSLLLGLVGISLFLSIVVRGYAWMAILDRRGVVNTLLGTDFEMLRNTPAVLIGLIQYGVPLMVFPLYNSMKRVDLRLLRASRNLGASGPRAFWGVYFPQTLHGVFAGYTVVFVVILGYYILPAILGGPQNTMIGEFIANQFLSTADFATGAAASLVLLACALGGYIVIQVISRIVIRGPRT
ncbi:ABC transporter permease [Leucobacter soli]|uniref:ABC transporter permease n=1 Tax=Leucobacter soli TaxID=2812850 RepID=UPI001C407E7F|nr:ABC transporter permease [Leucobacter soli]